MARLAERMLEKGSDSRKKAARILDSMEDPYRRLLSAIRDL